MIRQFHDFLNLISGGFLLFGPTMVRHEAKDHNRETKVSFQVLNVYLNYRGDFLASIDLAFVEKGQNTLGKCGFEGS